MQKRAQAQIDSVISRDRLPTFEDKLRLPYVEAFCKELLRWQVVTPRGAVPVLLLCESTYLNIHFKVYPICQPKIVSTEGLSSQKVCRVTGLRYLLIAAYGPLHRFSAAYQRMVRTRSHLASSFSQRNFLGRFYMTQISIRIQKHSSPSDSSMRMELSKTTRRSLSHLASASGSVLGVTL